MQRCHNSELIFYRFNQLADQGALDHGVFTRQGGVSTGHYDSLNVGSTVGDHFECVLENRRRIAAAMRVPEEATRTTWQVHGAEVVVVDQDTPHEWPPRQADAIITAGIDVPLVMRFADCVPVLVYDPAKHAVGMAHAGWKGTVLGAGAATVRAMTEHFGSRPEDLIAGIGPSIGPCCYEVGPEVVAAVRESFGEAGGLILPPKNGGGAHFDLWQANRRALAEAGVTQVEVAGICTSCNTDEFYSHRREQGKTGRFGTLIVLHGEG